MKKSYKLFGVFWDGKPIPEQMPEIKVIKVDCLNKKLLRLTDILRNEKLDMGNTEKVEQCMICIDYIPQFFKRCVLDFYLCRLLQIARYYNAGLVCENKKDKEQLSRMIDEFYKRKTPIRLLAQSDGASQMIC